MWMENDVLVYDATGPFNAEVVDCLGLVQRDFLLSITIPSPWASVGILHNSAMMTPEGIQRYMELMQSLKPPQLEPVATAFVIGSEVEGGRIMTPHFEKIYRSIPRPFAVCATLDEAMVWVRAQIQASRHAGG